MIVFLCGHEIYRLKHWDKTPFLDLEGILYISINSDTIFLLSSVANNNIFVVFVTNKFLHVRKHENGLLLPMTSSPYMTELQYSFFFGNSLCNTL